MASSKEYLDFILEQLSDRGFLKELPEVMYEELPALKKKSDN